MLRLLPYMVALMLGAGGCTDDMSAERSRVMDRIERLVRLPQNALPFDRYARYYGRRSDGRIEAVYLDPAAIPDPLNAGDRRWLDDVDDLPGVNDGGCHVVSVTLDPATGMVTAFCNGEA